MDLMPSNRHGTPDFGIRYSHGTHESKMKCITYALDYLDSVCLAVEFNLTWAVVEDVNMLSALPTQANARVLSALAHVPSEAGVLYMDTAATNVTWHGANNSWRARRRSIAAALPLYFRQQAPAKCRN